MTWNCPACCSNVYDMGASDQIEKTLSAWASRFYGANAVISDLKRLSGGASQETWAFDVKADLLLRMQALYDSVTIRTKVSELNVKPYTQAAE